MTPHWLVEKLCSGKALLADARLVRELGGKLQFIVIALQRGELGFGVEDIDDVSAVVINGAKGPAFCVDVGSAEKYTAIRVGTGVMGHPYEVI